MLLIAIVVLTVILILSYVYYRKVEKLDPGAFMKSLETPTETASEPATEDCEKEPVRQNRLVKPISERIIRQDNITVSNRYQAGFTRKSQGVSMASRCIAA